MKINLEDFKKGCTEFEWDGVKHFPPLTYNFNVHGGRVDDRDFIRTCLHFTAIVVMTESFQDAILDSDLEDAREVYRQFMSGDGFYSLEDEFETSAELSYGLQRTVCLDGESLYTIEGRVFNRIEQISLVVERIVENYVEQYVGGLSSGIALSAKYIAVALMTKNAENGDR